MSSGAPRTRMKKRRLVILAVSVVLLGFLYWYVKNFVSLDELVAKEVQVREAIERRPWRSFGIGLVIYSVVSLVPGTSGKSVIFGWLYGFWLGVAIILLGLTAAATTNFYLSRYVFREWIEQRYGKFLSTLNRHLEKEGAFYLLTLRMAHFPYSIINLVSGASRVGTFTFCWTTFLGLLPGTAIFAWLGSSLPSLDQVVANGVGSLIDWQLMVALAASATFPFLFRLVTRKLGILNQTKT